MPHPELSVVRTQSGRKLCAISASFQSSRTLLTRVSRVSAEYPRSIYIYACANNDPSQVPRGPHQNHGGTENHSGTDNVEIGAESSPLR